jgi:hypothetical protein
MWGGCRDCETVRSNLRVSNRNLGYLMEGGEGQAELPVLHI